MRNYLQTSLEKISDEIIEKNEQGDVEGERVQREQWMARMRLKRFFNDIEKRAKRATTYLDQLNNLPQENDNDDRQ